MIYTFQGKTPVIAPSAWVAPSADILGDVTIGEDSSIWFQCVLRGDVNFIKIGKHVNIQDMTLVHVSRNLYPVIIGDYVSIGHHATIHACTLKDHSFVGMGATVMDDVELGEWSFVGAGSLVPPGKKIPPGVLLMGSPAKIIRDITEKDREIITRTAENYVKYKENYRAEGIVSKIR
ncbi:gamma carbonic anhydrase family protein [Leptospira ognonensis]|uniref:Gamma carbonic anhydrase family protein n=1 Tax=Leptospira ognonensis TaxID=2484945 RepID=A0A4R9JXU2_9LEPT|nr:gamma carbonic anhydrase family protein [Leptospira ognonensis]TGL58027.1 gamma carbonic anhydrase family protein [Leptospira ognonensis]